MSIPNVVSRQTEAFFLGDEVVTRAELETLRLRITKVLNESEDGDVLVLDGFSTDYGGVDDDGFGRTVMILKDGTRMKIAVTPRDLHLAAEIMEGKAW